MKFLGVLVFLFLSGCASGPPMTEYEAAIHEGERQEKYLQWHMACGAASMHVITVWRGGTSPPARCRRSRALCIPHKRMWDFVYLSAERIATLPPGRVDWRPRGGNAVTCGIVKFR